MNKKIFSTFISHSSVDSKVANLICEYLEKKELSCWIAPRNIDTGNDYGSEIISGLEKSQSVLLLLSENSNKSEHVLREIERAAAKCLPIIVIELEHVNKLNKSFEYFISQRQWLSCYSENGLFNLKPYVYESIYKAIKTHTNPLNSSLKNSIFVKPSISRKYVWLYLLILLTTILVSYFSYWIYKQKIYSHIENINLKDNLQFGNYRNQPLIWSIYDIISLPNDSDNIELLLITSKPIAYKSFDVAHSGKFEFYNIGNVKLSEFYKNFNLHDSNKQYELARGSSDWNNSSLRLWLNSNQKIVNYQYALPTVDSITSFYKGEFNQIDIENLDEPGFLTNFSEKERSLLQVQKGKFYDYGIQSNCPIFPIDNYEIKLSERPKAMLVSNYSLMEPTNCTTSSFNELVTIPDIDDYYYLVSQRGKNFVDISYEYQHKSDTRSDSIWLKNTCGILPYEICIGLKLNYKNVDSNKNYVFYQSATTLSGVMPIITIKIPKNSLFDGNGTSNNPFKLIE